MIWRQIEFAGGALAGLRYGLRFTRLHLVKMGMTQRGLVQLEEEGILGLCCTWAGLARRCRSVVVRFVYLKACF